MLFNKIIIEEFALTMGFIGFVLIFGKFLVKILMLKYKVLCF